MRLVFSLLVLALCVPTAASAQGTQPGPRLLTVEGNRGRWFPLETAVLLRDEHLEVRDLRELQLKYQELVASMEQQLVTKDQRLASLRKAAGLATKRADLLDASLTALSEETAKVNLERDKLQSKLQAWYRRPIFWFAIGAIAGGATGVALAL